MSERLCCELKSLKSKHFNPILVFALCMVADVRQQRSFRRGKGFLHDRTGSNLNVPAASSRVNSMQCTTGLAMSNLVLPSSYFVTETDDIDGVALSVISFTLKQHPFHRTSFVQMSDLSGNIHPVNG